MKPNLFIVGAAKSGTTSLYQYLQQHPDIFFSAVKEPYHFSYPYLQFPYKGPGDRKEKKCMADRKVYEELFAGWNGERVVAEASVDYLYYHQCAKDIKAYAPEAKILIILRNPADRAFSAYKHVARDVREVMDFESSLAFEAERIKDNFSFIWHYRALGMYYEQVKTYLAVFGKKQVKVVIFEELFRNPEPIMKDILEFLDVDSSVSLEMERRFNASSPPRIKWLNRLVFTRESKLTWIKKVKFLMPHSIRFAIKEWLKGANAKELRMSQKTRDSLQRYFEQDIRKLEKLLERNLAIWNR